MKQRAILPVTAPVDETTDAPLRRFWWLKRILLLIGVFIGFVVGSWFWLNHRAERQLAAEIERWKQEGLPISLADFTPPPVPDDQNAALALNLAAHSIVDMKAWETQGYEDGPFDKYPWSPQTKDDAEKAVAKNHVAFEKLRAVRGLPMARWDLTVLDDILGSKKDPRKPDFGALRHLANMTRTAARAAHTRGDDAAVLEYLHDLQFMARTTAVEPSLISRLVSAGIDSMTASLTTEVAHGLQLDTPELRAQARERIAEWLSADRAGKWKPIARETVQYLEIVDKLDAMPLYSRGQPQSLTGIFQTAGWRFPRPVRLRSTVSTLARARREILAARLPDWPAVSAALPRATWARSFDSGVEPLGSMIRWTTQFEFASDRYLITCFRQQAQISFAAIHLALRLYAIDHGGKNPSNLAELVPVYLPMLPRDPFNPNGGPLRYSSATTQPFLYSLGTSPDPVVTGSYLPVLADHENWRKPVFVSFLNPFLFPATRPTTGPATLPISPKAGAE